jgi:hypothetical protein
MTKELKSRYLRAIAEVAVIIISIAILDRIIESNFIINSICIALVFTLSAVVFPYPKS